MTITDYQLYTQAGIHIAELGDFTFETGGYLPHIELAFETWGELNEDASNAVLVLHALTGDTHAASSPALPERGWWEDLIGPGKAVDTEKFFVVAPNIIGGCYGSTGPSSLDDDGVPYGSRFPFTTLRDSVHTEARLADALGIQRWHTVIGGSMGGGRALEWAATYPERVKSVAVIAIGAAATAEQIALAQSQTSAIELDANFKGGDYYGGLAPETGLGIARRIAHISYRSEAELQYRFGRNPQGEEDPFGSATQRDGRYQVESYLDYKASDLAGRFDANSYRVLTEALMTHDVARNRGSLQDAVDTITAKPFIAAVSSDRLYLPEQSYQLADAFGTDVHLIDSPIGHDGFLTSADQLREELIEELEL